MGRWKYLYEPYILALRNSSEGIVQCYKGTNSTDYDVTVGAYQTIYSGWHPDVFVTKIGTCMPFTVSATASPATICAGDSATLTASEALTYSWSTGQNTSTISVTPASTTTYAVTGADANGCTNTATLTVTVNPNNTITLIAGQDSQTVCVNEPIDSITYSSSGATGATFGGLPSGVTTSYYNGNIIISGAPTQIGTFNYTVTLMGGCGNVTASGKIVVNTCSGIESMTEGGGWSIYPNPSRGNFILQSERKGIFELMDVCGKVLEVLNVESPKEQIEVNLSKGISFIREKETGFTQKLVIE